MKHLLLILSIFLLTSPLFCQETGVLFQYKISSGFVWKTFGKDKVQPKYEGEVSAGIPEGFGILSYPFTDGKSVVGEWKDGKEWNTEHYSKEGIVLGKWENGKWILKWGVLFERMENGILVWSENGNEDYRAKYVGDIENMKPKGQGTITSPDGDKYEGEFKYGKKHGQGTFTSPDGKKYDGEWKDGTYHGHGTYTFGKGKWEGDKYIGEFKNGKKDGQGTYTFSDGRKYVGEFKNGKQHGQGIFTTPSGNKYVGEFKDGKQHGKGTLTSRFEKEYIGEFKEGTLWNITEYDKNGNILTKTINGEKQQ